MFRLARVPAGRSGAASRGPASGPRARSARRARRAWPAPGARSAWAGRRVAGRSLLHLHSGAVGVELLERGADDARDVHLRAADDLGDLGLQQVLLEAQAQDLARAVVEDARQA